MRTILPFVLSVGMLSVPLLADPQLTEVEQLKIQVFNLQSLLVKEQTKSAQLTIGLGQCQLQQAQGQKLDPSDLTASITQNHPGWTFHPDGTWTVK